MKIITNHHYRPTLSASDLTPKELEDFDYLEEGEGLFIRYRGSVYDLGEFVATQSELGEWEGITHDTAFSGIAIKFSADNETVKVASLFC